MISKNKIKYIHSLELKKNRNAEKVFVAEGPKLVGDLLPVFPVRLLAATQEWINRGIQISQSCELITLTQEELQKISFLKTPQEVLAVFEQPDFNKDESHPESKLCLALDDVQDPGNLGTIIRLADWFGIEDIFCSHGTVDVYNPKTIQATMGGIARIRIHYVNLEEWLRTLPAEVPVYGTFLDGENLYDRPLTGHGVIIMGNEGKGISRSIGSLVNERLYIPNYPAERETSESLNVAIATAVICAEFRRRSTIH